VKKWKKNEGEHEVKKWKKNEGENERE